MRNVNHDKNIIETSSLSFDYNGEEVLKDINLQIHRGDYLSIVGPNGGGKTTLVKCILNLLRPTKGKIKIFDQDLNIFKNWSRIGYIPQKINFDPNFPSTAKEVVAMGLYSGKGLYQWLTKEDWENVDKALGQVGMQKFKDRRIGELSGGQQQRVFIARALVSNPEVIFLDEPTVGVDTDTRHQFFKLLNGLNKNLDLTLVLVTHDIDIILNHGVTEVAFVNERLLFYGSPDELLKTKYIDEHYQKNF